MGSILRTHRLRCITLVCLGAMGVGAAGWPGTTVALSNFELTFLSVSKAHVKGTVICNGLRWPDPLLDQGNDLQAGFQFADAGQSFPVLVDRANSYSGTPGARRKFTAYAGGRELDLSKPFAIRPTSLTPLEVLNELLYYAGQERTDQPGDDGRPFSFDRLMDFSLLRTPERYRLLVRLEQTLDQEDRHNRDMLYTWIVYGPFKWGQAPPLTTPLTATTRQQAHFTGGGTGTGVPAGTTGAGGGTGSVGSGKPGPSAATAMRLTIAGKLYTGPSLRVVNGAAMAPMMPFFQAAHIAMSYERATHRLMILGRKTVVMWAGKSVATVDGQQVPLANPPVMVGSEMYIPLRFTVESVGGTLKWDAATKAMDVTFPPPPQ